MTIKIGKRYLVVGELTTTDQSRLYLARDLLFNHTVVIKEVITGQLTQIEREYEVLHQLQHPNLVQAIDLVAKQDQVFLVLTHAPGLDFVSWARRDRSPRRLCEGTAAVLRGLQYIHRRGAVHRDIKPHNIRVAESQIGTLPAARIVDFGLASFDAHAATESVGTPGYLPPEVLAGEPAAPASDLFSLGAMLFEALTDTPGGYDLGGRKGAAAVDTAGALGGLGEIAAALLDDDPDARPGAPQLFDALGEIAGRPLQLDAEELGGDYLPSSPLVGRHEQLSRLDAEIERVAGGAGRLLCLEGVGRRAFVAEVAARARLRGVQVFEVDTGLSLEREVDGDEPASGNEPLHRRASRLVDRLAAWPRPLLICCDLREGEEDRLLEATLDQLTRLHGAGAAPGGLLLLLTAPRAGLTLVQLPDLTAQQVTEQVRGLLYHVEAIPWLGQVRGVTGGDPELVTALVRRQIEAGLPDALQEQPQLSKIDLERLDARQRELLACLAHAAAPVPPEILDAVIPPEVRAALPELVSRGLLKISSRGVAPQSSALAQRAAEAITGAEAQALHRRYADAYAAEEHADPAILGHHLIRSRQAEAAAPLLLAAGARRADLERAAELLSPAADDHARVVARLARLSRAEGDLDRALEQLERLDDPEQAALLRAELLLDAGQPARALQALELAETPGGQLLLLRARAHVLLGESQAAAAAAEAGLALEGLAAARRVELQNVAGLAALYLGREADALRLLTQARRAARALDQPEALARVLNSLGIAHQRLGQLDRAAGAYQESLALFRSVGDLRLAASCALNLGTLAHRQSSYEEALSHYRAATALGQRSALGATTIWALANEANLLLLFGDVGAAEERLALATRLCEQQGGGRSLGGHILLYRADARRLGGDPSGARALLERALRRFESTDRPGREAAALLGFELDLLQGAVDEAAAGCARLLERLAPDAPDRHVACLIGGRAALALEPPNLERAGQLLEQAAAREASASGGDERAWEVEAALAALWEARGDAERQRDHARRCAEAVARLRGRVPAQFRACFDARPDLKRATTCLSEETPGSRIEEVGLARLLAINEELSGALPLESLLELILDSAIELTGAERGFILLRRGGRLRLAGARNADREPLRRGAAKYSRSIARQVVSDGCPAVLTDAQEDRDFAGRQSISDLRLRAVLCAPLRARDETRGALYLDNRFTPGLFDERTVSLAAAFAVQACIALENARLFDESARQRDELAEAKAAVEALNRRLAAQVARQSQQLSEITVRLAHQEEELVRRYNAAKMIGRSKPMLELFASIDRVADAEVPVVIHGESGTGKELAARAIHQSSPRRAEPFVALNCGALPANLLESELFGYARGAFTGAGRDRAGLFEAAGGGTLLLDEIGDMNLEMQVKLLRVLQERTFRRLGDQDERRSRCRVLAASHRDLARLVTEGRFREDLYYRLKVVQLEVPPLRRRREDIPLLTEHFLAQEQQRRTISPPALRALIDHDWPGNVRQLHNELQRAALLGGELIALADLSDELRQSGEPAPDGATAKEAHTEGEEPSLREALRRHERRLIERALQRSGASVTAAAATLGLHRVALHRRMRALGIAGVRGKTTRRTK
jgi:transcriptional regulator with GAF, ATPase, and Fis domain/tetratricopeptide (TPR) repeat protein